MVSLLGPAGHPGARGGVGWVASRNPSPWGGTSLLIEESTQDRVMVFLDLRNVMASDLVQRRKAQGWDIDLVALVRSLPGHRRLVGVYAFDTLHRRPDGYIPGLSLVRALRFQGFRVITTTDEPDEPGTQKEADVMLATELLVQAFQGTFDVAIVVSGDRDFIPAIRAAQNLGKRVEVAALQGTYVSKLVESADRFHILDELPFLRPLEDEAA